MADIVAQWPEGAHWRVQYRLYTRYGDRVEPIVDIPLSVWLVHDERGRAELVESGVAFGRLHHPDKLEEEPDGERGADGGADEGAAGAGRGDPGPTNDAQPRRARWPRR